MNNHKKFFVILSLILVPMLGWAAPSSPKIEWIITNFDDDELVILGSDLSDNVNTPSVELGGFLLVVTDFDANSITADAVLNSFVPGDYLLLVDANTNGSKPVEILLTLNPPGDSVAGKSCDTSFECGNGVVENGAPLVGFADDGSLICMYPEECDDGNTSNGDGCSATCTAELPPDVDLTKTAPAATNASTITYTIEYDYPAEAWVPAGNLVLTDAIPAGTTYVNFSATGGGVHSAGVVTWNLPDLNPGDVGAVSFSVSVLSDGTFENTAELEFSNGVDRMVSSNTTVTERDTVAPGVTIIGPDGATVDGVTTYDSTPSFTYSSSETPVTYECKVDLGTYEPCPPSPFTTVPLSVGPHTVYVRAIDEAGNIGSDSRSFDVAAAICGNLVVEPPEECDDGNVFDGDGCSATCTVEAVCGNGVVEPPETCDDGNSISGDGCSAICTVEAAVCGNTIIEPPETCDDGNIISGDGCSATCTVE